MNPKFLSLTFLLAATASPLFAGSPLVTVPWTVEIVDGPYDGEIGTGSFTYDPVVLLDGDEILSPTFGSLDLEMTILGQTFTAADDIDFIDFPELVFFEFEPDFIDFVVAEEGFNPIEITEPGVSAIFMAGELIPDPAGGYFSFGTIIPEPTSLVLFALGMAGVAVRWRKR